MTQTQPAEVTLLILLEKKLTKREMDRALKLIEHIKEDAEYEQSLRECLASGRPR